jgi:nucleoside-diphosphate-sugar epimerase
LDGHVFITGASGRIAARLIPALLGQGERVVGLARTDAKADAVRALGAQCLVGPLSRPDVIDQGLEGAHTVYHLAGGIRGPGQETPDRINRLGTLDLIDRLSHHPHPRALVFTSSVAVHGDRSGLWVDEDMPPHPNTRYGRSKMAAEHALLAAKEANGLPVRIVRLAAVYGPGFPFMLETPIRQGRAWLPGEGRNIVPTIHVDDAVEGIIRVASPDATHTIYNLADQQPVSLREFYTAVAQATGGQAPRFWSTWVPSALQFSAARWMERAQSRTATTPKFTPDSIRLFTASVRLNVERIASDTDFEWRHPCALEGIATTIQGG